MEQLMEAVIRPVLGKQEMQELAARLGRIHEASRKAWEQKTKLPHPKDALPIMTGLDFRTPKSLMAEVDDRATGLDYAAHCIGIALASCGGLELMTLVHRMVEDQHGMRASHWLDHRWNCVQEPGGGMWCS